jgi:hypothetical protein
MIEQPTHDQGERIPTGAELTALDPTFRTDPHPVLARLRRDEPAHYDRVINRWILTRHDDVERVLRDRTMSLDPHKANEGTYMRLFLPPPDQAANMLFRQRECGTSFRILRASRCSRHSETGKVACQGHGNDSDAALVVGSTHIDHAGLLGEINSRRDPPEIENAEDRYREVFTQAIELGMRPLVAQCHLGLGKLYRRTGNREQAREHLNTAATMYHEMGMTYWLEQAEAEIGGSA